MNTDVQRLSIHCEHRLYHLENHKSVEGIACVSKTFLFLVLYNIQPEKLVSLHTIYTN